MKKEKPNLFKLWMFYASFKRGLGNCWRMKMKNSVDKRAANGAIAIKLFSLHTHTREYTFCTAVFHTIIAFPLTRRIRMRTNSHRCKEGKFSRNRYRSGLLFLFLLLCNFTYSLSLPFPCKQTHIHSQNLCMIHSHKNRIFPLKNFFLQSKLMLLGNKIKTHFAAGWWNNSLDSLELWWWKFFVNKNAYMKYSSGPKKRDSNVCREKVFNVMNKKKQKLRRTLLSEFISEGNSNGHHFTCIRAMSTLLQKWHWTF